MYVCGHPWLPRLPSTGAGAGTCAWRPPVMPAFLFAEPRRLCRLLRTREHVQEDGADSDPEAGDGQQRFAVCFSPVRVG